MFSRCQLSFQEIGVLGGFLEAGGEESELWFLNYSVLMPGYQ